MTSSKQKILLTITITSLLILSSCGFSSSEEGTSTNKTVTSDEENHSDDDGDDHDDDHKDDDDHDDDESKSGLGSHEHGTAELFVAWTEGDFIIDLISPAQNIYGFEYVPSTDEDKAIVEDRNKALSAPGIVAINAEADCQLAGDVKIDLEIEGSHSEVTTSWNFICENIDQIKQLDAGGLFEEFPNFEDVDAQWASNSGQSSAELSPTATILQLG